MSAKLGEVLLKEGLITPQQLKEALDYQRAHGGRLGSIFVSLGIVQDEAITAVLSRQYGVPAVNLDLFDVDPNAVRLLPEETARKYMVMPLARNGSTMTLAMVDPANVFAIDDIKFMTGLNIEQVVVSELSLERALARYYAPEKGLVLAEKMSEFSAGLNDQFSLSSLAGGANVPATAPVNLDEAMSELNEALGDTDLEVSESNEDVLDLSAASADEAPVVKLVNMILVSSLEYGASDIHIEPYEKEFRVRFRVDGLLREVMRPPMKMRAGLTSRIKIMAKLDIAETRLPQDGRIKIKLKRDTGVRDLDFRVSTLPTLWGEKIVLRLLDKEKLMLDMTKLGFEPESLEKFKRQIAKPYGMVLVTGPTGSGKTNTLYSALASLNTPDTNIMTAEDPVEFNLTGINQVQMKEQIGLNFAAALRSFLRQDPNIVLVGEIRDFETAEIAVKASLTGHLVLSTLHTNDAPSTVSRLMNMGIEPFLVATSVNLIQAQRLIRRICTECKAPAKIQPPAQTLIELGFTPEEASKVVIYEGTGKTKDGRECPKCKGSGYKGRVGLYEVMEMNDELRELILIGASALELRKKAIEHGMLTLRRSGLRKIMEGITTIEEVVRETVL
ncbi:type IV-A pilus assembly ATPase PilB [Chloracidobacterium aggregatum]|uniref:Type IV-A pilus assembly ATPase PilB n=1 Tax=Chloracidobacterium sp. N TaxID=2821540 RepID=A0ABX8AXE5_9BACT|nr:type IV-A pilus assembly ATPase PilB [Chloracidobacterium aggregatum]QUV84256.1 type IV-A pilus assembly ATPase PilB [Chloracidobacterium sp. 2]QUV87255.1 type IV-A pilus assembly ATPase PilB [Chloracidobacterium sp. S]QUV90161.1 type IV-A pilus assembly ATPase PilB [Chloracidobacterium sp. A]QUV93372.1 type IV-A pilus assembly ATPase PilB [Chloracidobacterium sp. N]QUV96528.1 type IV-A pilus assembly ATPase PilB [Chloracidobacterium sp. E]